ncbi:YdeI/OmpD-associated family protein [Rhodococcoides corynebacterioides]|uniref:YdeI/OmpD-associated family protein n=1 Tax=Rhodococcoides corynebacterioides TaxID=53972 RepID=UPI003F7E46D2
MTALRLTTELVRRGPAAAIVLTDQQVETLGPAKTPPVRVTIGDVTVRVRIGRMGGENLVGLNKAVRAELGVEAGRTVDALVELDEQSREVDVPTELAEALDAEGVRAAFDALAPSARKEHARAVADAKRADTRARRVAAVVAALRGA